MLPDSDRMMTFQDIEAHLRDQDVAFERVAPDTVRMSIYVGGQLAHLLVQHVAKPVLVRVSVPLPFLVPADHRDSVAIRLARINNELNLLGFLLDHDSGVVSYRSTFVGNADGSFSRYALAGHITTALNSANRHAVAIAATAGLSEAPASAPDWSVESDDG